MILHVQQTMQDMFAADFQILRNNISVGNMTFRGRLNSPNGEWDVAFYNHRLELGRDATIRQGLPRRAYRPYQIYINRQLAGHVFNETVKISFLVLDNVLRVYLDGKEFTMYCIGLGEEGAKNPIYCGDTQIAQVEKDCVVYNGLYQYRVYARDEYAAKIALIFCTYMYSCGAYEPGMKVVNSVSKAVSITKIKSTLEKYNPSFAASIEP